MPTKIDSMELLSRIRTDFVGLDMTYALADGRTTRRIYLDSTASTLMMGVAHRAIGQFLEHYANTHSQLHFPAKIASREYAWAHVEVEAGNDIAVSARECKMGTTLAWAFDQKINGGNTLAVLETLESFYRTNYSYRVNLARFILAPCSTIGMGIMVGFIVYAIFIPLVEIINHYSYSVTP